MTDKPFFHINSEIGKLEAVLLHRPGKELERLTPQSREELLFDDIPWLVRMQEEHDRFARVLSERGCRVYYFSDLLKDILRLDTVREDLLGGLFHFSGISRLKEQDAIHEYLTGISADVLAEVLIAGLAKSDIPYRGEQRSLTNYITEDYPYYINPLPNLYFARDPGTVIGNGIAINSMKTTARSREPFLLSYINRYHPVLGTGDPPLWYDFNLPGSIEGGDILILNKNVVAIGCSARTSPEAIEKISENLINSNSPIKEVLVIQIPFKRAYMHLDTVFTMLDRDKFIIFPGIIDEVKIFSMKRGSSRAGLEINSGENLEKALCRSLKLDQVKIIHSGGGDRITADREQWNDSTNTLAIAPGTVVTYRRNTASNAALRKGGIDVVEIDGSELVRGRGGPRCMSMPLNRKDLD